ncbi:MAG TPA: hypothetical protein VFV32_05980 [Acidimicrobiales bacterium]|jgi:hypothetical protein|nr:hypothetical protein [Acidimicrobiales bacterium]
MAQDVQGVILLDVSPGSGEAFEQSFLEKVGHPARVCHGPHEEELCPLLAGKGCQKFEDAHGIIFELDLDRPQHRAIVHRYRQLGREDLPIRVVATADQAARYADVLEGIEVWTHEPTVAELDGFAAEVEAADR